MVAPYNTIPCLSACVDNKAYTSESWPTPSSTIAEYVHAGVTYFIVECTAKYQTWSIGLRSQVIRIYTLQGSAVCDD